jgi:hypothetical protein
MHISGDSFLFIIPHPCDCISEVPHLQLLIPCIFCISFSIKWKDLDEMPKVRYFTAEDGHRLL